MGFIVACFFLEYGQISKFSSTTQNNATPIVRYFLLIHGRDIFASLRRSPKGRIITRSAPRLGSFSLKLPTALLETRSEVPWRCGVSAGCPKFLGDRKWAQLLLFPPSFLVAAD